MKINLNADCGESFGAYSIGDDAALLQIVRSANVACGFHGGDPGVMRQTVALCAANGVSVGAHPGFADLPGFGRRPMKLSLQEVRDLVIVQIGALQAVAAAQGGRVTHVKPHGALNNMACEDADLAGAIAAAVRDVDRDLILLAPVLSELAKAGEAAGLPTALEVFADRAYTDTGMLVNRREPGAVIKDAAASLSHVTAMLEAGAIISVSGKRLPTPIHSVCVHGDEPTAVEAAAIVRDGLRKAGQLVTLPELF